jgi:A/G-specific adenine glycosylase
MVTPATQKLLLEWYRQNARELPWRANRDPYRIWISETMLQQTTTTAVIPFFERFTQRFPDLKTLASAPVEAVVEAWAGLGYYSRARNLHKSARALQKAGGFPRTFEQLIKFPGFGPYTARSVASLAFDQNVGVVDGNVIRVLARYLDADWEWWRLKTRARIQDEADLWVKDVSAYEMNQALMELGRTICTPKSPTCLMCPLRLSCQARAGDTVALRPQVRPRREREIWLWEPHVFIRGGRILLQKNQQAPFLRDQWLLPATARRLKKKPEAYHYKHSITHHDIFVTVREELPKLSEGETKWVTLGEIRQHVPVSLVQKALSRRLPDSDDADVHVETQGRRRKHFAFPARRR